MDSKKTKYKEILKKTWNFIWNDDSIYSWLVNIVLAFVIIKFMIYPFLGLVLGTTHPIVAVVSESMDHDVTKEYKTDYILSLTESTKVKRTWTGNYVLCGNEFEKKERINFDSFWDYCGDWYSRYNISKEDFKDFKMSNGFSKGDIIVLNSKKNAEVGDIIVFWSKGIPIIHRIVNIEDGMYTTKGDHNQASLVDEVNISEDRVIGKAFFKIPYIGYVKIWFSDLINLIKG